MSICSPFGTNYFFILMACFCYSSFMILLLHVLFEKLNEFQIQAKKITTSLYILSSHSEWRPRTLGCIIRIFLSFKEKLLLEKSEDI